MQVGFIIVLERETPGLTQLNLFGVQIPNVGEGKEDLFDKRPGSVRRLRAKGRLMLCSFSQQAWRSADNKLYINNWHVFET